MERGIRRQEIFKEDMDYEMFLAILKKVVESYEAKVRYKIWRKQLESELKSERLLRKSKD